MFWEIECSICGKDVSQEVFSIFKEYEGGVRVTHASCRECYDEFKEKWEKNGWKVLDS